MRERRPDSFNAAFGFFAMVAGAVLAAAVVVLFATVPIWGWLALVTFLLLTGTALLSFTDPDSRAFLAGTLRKWTYTQIYTTLTRRLVMRLWSALCDPAEDRASVPSLFRAALTWRLYDKALLIAVAYPILLPVGQWIVTGDAARIGEFQFCPPRLLVGSRGVARAHWPSCPGFRWREMLAAASRHRVMRQAADLAADGSAAVSLALRPERVAASGHSFQAHLAFAGAFSSLAVPGRRLHSRRVAVAFDSHGRIRSRSRLA
jgi:hypothetical protein